MLLCEFKQSCWEEVTWSLKEDLVQRLPRDNTKPKVVNLYFRRLKINELNFQLRLESRLIKELSDP